jgi:hypothetical protein
MHPITMLALVGGGVVAASALSGPVMHDIDAEPMGPKRAPRPLPDRLKKKGLVVWGEGGTWEPSYMKSVGCEDVRWGFCFREYIDGIRRHPDAPKTVAEVEKWVQRVLMFIDPTGAKIAQWIVKNVCLTFKFRLSGYNLQSGSRYYSVSGRDTSVQVRMLDNAAPPHPLPAKKGYKRVWIATGLDNGLRNPDVLTVFWPGSEEGGPVIQELLGRTNIRALLRMDHRVEGALKPKALAEAGCGKSKWWVSTRKKALKYDK